MKTKKIHSVVIAFSILLASLFCLINPLNYKNMLISAVNTSQMYYYYNYNTQLGGTYTLTQLSTDGAMPRYSLEQPENRVIDPTTAVVQLSNGGTGFIVGDNVIATAAHCVYDGSKHHNSGYNFSDGITNFTIKIKSIDGRTTLKTLNPTTVHFPFSYGIIEEEPIQSCYDYALIYVQMNENESLTDYGCFGLGIMNDNFLINNSQITTSGFPSELYYGSNVQEYDGNHISIYGTRYKSVGNIEFWTDQNTQDKRFRSNNCTSGGDSGGPAYVKTLYDGKIYYTAIGIVTGAPDPEIYPNTNVYMFNGTYGVRVTTNLLHFYYNNQHLASSGYY